MPNQIEVNRVEPKELDDEEFILYFEMKTKSEWPWFDALEINRFIKIVAMPDKLVDEVPEDGKQHCLKFEDARALITTAKQRISQKNFTSGKVPVNIRFINKGVAQ